MVFSKPIIPLATLLLAAQLAAAEKSFGTLDGDLSFVDTPPINAELSAWLASKPSKTGSKTGNKTGTKTSSKSPARRTVGAKPEISAFVDAVESVYGELIGSESSVSLVQPIEATVPTGVPTAVPTAIEGDGSYYVSSGEESTYSEDLEPADEEISSLAARTEEGDEEGKTWVEPNTHETPKIGRIISKSRIIYDDASTFQDGPSKDASGNAADSSWGKRDRSSGPGGYDGSGVKGEGKGEGRGEGRGEGKGQGMGEGKGQGKGQGKGEGKGFAGGKTFGHGSGPGMKRGVPENSRVNGTAPGRPERPAAVPSGVKPGTAKPTGAAWWPWGNGDKHGVKPTSTPAPTAPV